MSELNKANRQVCDVDIRVLSTKKPFMKADSANVTTAGFSSDAVYAMAKGARKIVFSNPLEGTMTMEFQVMPFKLYALYNGGKIENSATFATSKTVKATAAGTLSLADVGGTIVTGSVFAYPVGAFGDESKVIEGNFSEGTFTAATTEKIAEGAEYEVAYMVTKSTNVKKVAINNKNLPSDYIITMNTVDKDEEGVLTPFIMTAYKASVQRNLELSFSSEGDPATVTVTFDLMEDKDGNVLDLVEITE